MSHLIYREQDFEVNSIKVDGEVLSATVNGDRIHLQIFEGDDFYILEDGVPLPLFAVKDEKNNVYVQYKGRAFEMAFTSRDTTVGHEEENDGNIKPPMPGKVLEINIREGDEVKKNQVLILMESMKLQVEIKSPFDGIIKEILCEKDTLVDSGDILIVVE